MIRVELTDAYVRYQYTQPIYESYEHRPGQFRQRVVGENIGVIELDRHSGTIKWLSGSAWDTDGFNFNRAAQKVAQAFRSNNYPAELVYAA